MVMKSKIGILVLLSVITVTLLCADAAYARSISQTVHLVVRVVGVLSMDLENEWLRDNMVNPNAEAFSELKEHNILVDKLRKDKSTIWLLTKTE